jgi:deazaflavin-dependent oxidoreductase (nitroreductase family)
MTASSPIPLLARFALSTSEFINKRGIYLGRRSTKVHVALYRRSGGRIGGGFPGLPAAPILLLDHTGAKSGIRRTSPLIYYEEGDLIAVVASKAGQATNPAWLHNLIAHPCTSIQLGSEIRKVRARLASREERAQLWPKFVAFYPGFEAFQRMAKGREIPILILEPVEKRKPAGFECRGG